MKYFCVSCNYTYDESLWDKDEGIGFWTRIDEIESCPNCWEAYSFQWIEEEVNYLDSEENLDGLEVEHIPTVRYDGDIVEVVVGKKAHPMWDDHRITEISLYDEYWDRVYSEILHPESEDPVAEFDVGDLDEFEIRVKCSVHGVWWRKFER